jgi:hypothetical protein
MYDADPFDARKRLQKEMTEAHSSSEAARSFEKDSGRRPKFDLEVLMAASLRDLVEDAIKQVCSVLLLAS